MRITTASSTAVAAVSPAAVHTPREDEDEVTASACTGAALAAAVVRDGVGFGSALSGGTSVPTGATLVSALKPQSSSEAACR